MALLWVDGFEAYGSSGNILAGGGFAQRYAVYGLTTNGNFRVVTGAAGVGLGVHFAGNDALFTPALTSCHTIIVGFDYYVYGAGVPVIRNIVDLREVHMDGSNAAYAAFRLLFTANGTDIATKIGDGVVSNCFTLAAPITNNTWYHIEAKIYRHATDGTVIVKVDGVETINVASINTVFDVGVSSYVGCSWYTTGTVNTQFYLDNVFVCDTTGNTCNDFLGQCKVVTYYPTGDSSGDWTQNSGATKYEMVDQAALDTTNYIKETATGNQQLFNYTSNITGNIQGLQVNTDCTLSGNLMKGIRHVSQNGAGTIKTHPIYPLGSVQTNTITDAFSTDPDGNPLTNAILNGCNYGVKVV